MAALFAHTVKTLSVVNIIFTTDWVFVLALAIITTIVISIPFVLVTAGLDSITHSLKLKLCKTLTT
jgi:hypothetical protein